VLLRIKSIFTLSRIFRNFPIAAKIDRAQTFLSMAVKSILARLLATLIHVYLRELLLEAVLSLIMENYHVIQLIGEGSFGKVYKVCICFVPCL
jgi:hypothetical protein